MLNKVMKHMQKRETSNNPAGKNTTATGNTDKTYPTSGMPNSRGFDARKSSDKGAERARSIGNRLRKPSSSK
jgi:hypothetical protein